MIGLHVQDGRVRLCDDLADPPAVEGETVVQMLRAGVCATDLALVRGYMGFAGIPGHEFVGRALAGPFAGQRVVGEINAACGSCEQCDSGLGRHCPQRTVLGILGRPGAFAERLALPQANLRLVPPEVSTDAATFTEPLAAAFEITEQLDLSRFESALVVGDGRLGLLCAMVLCRAGVKVVVSGHHPERRELLGGAVEWLPGAEPGTPPSRRFDLVVEATGRPEILQTAIASARPRGTVVLKTTAEVPAPLDLAPVVIDEIQIVGSRCGPFAPALQALARREFPVESLIDSRYPLRDADAALEHAAQPGVLKVLITGAD